MNINNFIAEFKAENESYVAMGLVDDISLWKWILDALKPFGMNIMEQQSTMVEVFNSKAVLPDHFHSLKAAWWCEPHGYSTKAPKSVLQQSRVWTERVERGRKWNTCEPCCAEAEEKVITERLYIEEEEVSFHYKNPTLLKLGKSRSMDWCATDCQNKVVKSSPYEIVIKGHTIHTNFAEGNIFVRFWGNPVDEDGVPIIPDEGMGEVEKYVEAYVYKKLYEKVVRGKEDENAISLLKLYIDVERDQRSRAITATKFSKLSMDSFRKIRNMNRLDMLTYELNFPSL